MIRDSKHKTVQFLRALLIVSVCAIALSSMSAAPLAWATPKPMNSNACHDFSYADDMEPFAATDEKGTWLSVWSSNGPIGGAIIKGT